MKRETLKMKNAIQAEYEPRFTDKVKRLVKIVIKARVEYGVNDSNQMKEHLMTGTLTTGAQ